MIPEREGPERGAFWDGDPGRLIPLDKEMAGASRVILAAHAQASLPG